VFHVKLPGHDEIARQADEHLVTHRVILPRKVVERPIRQVAKRLAMALFVLAATAFIVWVDRDGYNDNAGDGVDFLDSLYYATVTLSTTGYGDITPVSDAARLTNIFVITPLRVLFLIILVGTTLEVLTERTRDEWRRNRWSQWFAGCTPRTQRRIACIA
jgi:voltage-gated potassium channel